jgi:RNA polymerase sigma factor (sigma-70 family)
MTTGPTNRVLTHLRRLALRHEPGGTTDAQLLERFLARREEVAFEELVRRHGPMVLGVCRRVLGEPHAAADAFQATFLVLVRRAASIVPRSRVGPWLYGVARRTALKARSSAARRHRAEQEAARGRPHAAPPADPDGDLRPLLDEELGRLPEKYRAPLVLCLLEGKSRKEAAGLLGWSEGTLSGRLARAKERLGARLRRRGVAVAGAGLLAGAAAVPASLAAATVKAAASDCVSPPVIALTEEVLKAMLMSKVKAVAGVLVLVAGIGIGAGAVARQYGPAAPGAVPTDGYADARPAAALDKKAEPRPPAYVIEPPDVLRVEYGRLNGSDPVKIVGERLVRPDGTISLGQLGSVPVSGRTPEEARRAIGKHLARRLDEFDVSKLSVEVVAYNSKVFYVIADGAAGEQVHRFPATGNEAVLDAIEKANVSLVGLGQKGCYILRRSADGKGYQKLDVDVKAIVDGNAATNYILLPGDRFYVKSLKPPKKAEGPRRTGAVPAGGPDAGREKK